MLFCCREETYVRILKTTPRLPSHLSQHARDFVSQCLRKDPSHRPTVPQLLRHPWISFYQVKHIVDSEIMLELLGAYGLASPLILEIQLPRNNKPIGVDWLDVCRQRDRTPVGRYIERGVATLQPLETLQQ